MSHPSYFFGFVINYILSDGLNLLIEVKGWALRKKFHW